MNFLFVGDVVGSPGRSVLHDRLRSIVERHQIDFVIVNGENSAGGLGITPKIVAGFFRRGVDVITTGNHIWRNKEILKVINDEERILRPINYPVGAPGKGSGLYEKNGVKVGVVNSLGRIFMEALDCPFKATQEEGKRLKKAGADILILDFHAEATSEKIAMGHHLDGLYSLVFGTHTHVQTSDARILGSGTGYVTDVGMTGPTDSVIGVLKERAISKFITGMPAKFDVAKDGIEIDYGVCAIDPASGKATDIFMGRESWKKSGSEYANE